MKVAIYANMFDQALCTVAEALQAPLQTLSTLLEGDYGGLMDHLWIDFELLESHARPDGNPLHSFRFAKRVSGRSHFGLPRMPDSYNVGHYSVRPDFYRLETLPTSQALLYSLSLIYNSTRVLIKKRKRLGGFDAERFRARFLEGCKHLGYEIPRDRR